MLRAIAHTLKGTPALARSLTFASATLAAGALCSQTQDTVGGTTSSFAGSSLGKANLYQVDTTTLLTSVEMHLNVPMATTITWFVHRANTRTGPARLVFSTTTTPQGTSGAQWFTSGSIALPLVCGNHYLIGASWDSSVTYSFDTSTVATTVSFGNWQRGNTLSNPPPASIPIRGGDSAQYFQRLTTLSLAGSVTCGANASCATSTGNPRLVASTTPTQGSTLDLEIIGGSQSALVVHAFADGAPQTTATPLLGCQVWLNLNSPVFTLSALTDPAGLATTALTIPANPTLIGTQQSVQSAVLGATIDMTNVLGLTVN